MVEKTIECKVVKELMIIGTEKAGARLRIVRWIVDGKDTGALLEKRIYYHTKDGAEKMGKAKGFNLSDVKYIVDHWKEIEPLL